MFSPYIMEHLLSFLLYVQLVEVIIAQQYFRVKPHDTSVVAGKTAELHCHIGNRAGHVQWSKDGFLLGYDPKIPGYERYEMRVDHSKSAYTLLVHEASLDDEAEFQCQVGPGKNEKPIRSVARLTVLVPPKHLSINDLPNGSEIEVREAEKVILVCQAISSKPATILKWYRKSIELMPEAYRTTVRREGEKSYSTLSSITLYPKGDTAGTSYTCEALHPAIDKTLKTTVTVGVLYPPGHPEINGFREGDIVHSGDHLTLICSSAGGKPPARLTWYRNAELMEGSYSTIGRDASNTISFTVRDVDNNAVYSCAATNPLTPRALVSMVRLSVLFSPSRVFIEGPSEIGKGETATLTCRTDPSNPPTDLTWLVDGVTFEPHDTMTHLVENGWYTSSNLTATITRQDKDVKVFTCLAHGSPSHEKVFQNFNVTVLYPPDRPQITGFEEESDLREGEFQSFTCSAPAGNPPAELRWYRGDYQVPTQTDVVSGHISSILTLQLEPSDNEITIRCAVNNSALLDPLSTQVKLSVLFPPPNVTISVDPPQPKEGEEVRLECWSGSSNPAAQIFWWRDGALFPGLHNHVKTTDSAFGGSSTHSRISLPATSAEHGSRFTCEAKNDAFQHSVRDQITLHVLYAPAFISPGKVVELVEGEPGEVNMSAHANPVIHTYRWSRAGIDIPSRSDNFRESPRVSVDGAVLYFRRVSRHDSGAYTCVAKNLQGSASASLTLNVLYPATVLNISGAVETAEGESTHLECIADGNPLTEKTIRWRMIDDPEQTLVAYSPESGRSILTILNVTRKDGGVIECIADNGIGSPFSSASRIIILYRPSILRRKLKRRVATGERESAELNCGAEGHPDVNFAWSFNGSTIGSGRADSAKYDVRQTRRKDQEWWSTLLVNSITQGDYGVYTCIANNQMGHDFVTFNLGRRSIPDPPDRLESLNVSHQGALLQWSPGFDGGLPQSFLLKVRKNQETSFAVAHIPANSTSYLITGLQQGTQYELTIAAKNGIGESRHSEPFLFRTKSLPVMDSTISRPDASSGSSSVEFLPAWLLAAAVIGSLVVMANVLVCIIYIRRKRWCRTPQAAAGPQDMEDDISREKMSKKIPSEEHSPFYLTGTSVDIPDDGLDLDSFQKAPNIRQVSRDSSEDGHSSGRRCDCGGRQWSSTLICGGRAPGENRTGNQHEQCPDILKRDSCHCHASVPAGQRISEAEVEVSSTLGAVMYGKHERPELSSDIQDYPPRDQLNPPQITLTTFQSKSELPIRHTIIGPKLETVINGHDEDS